MCCKRQTMIKKMRVGYDPALPTENVYAVPCPILHALDVIGGKWKLPVLWHLADSPCPGFNALKRGVKGITTMMLSKCVKELEQDGLIRKTEKGGKCRCVEYALTEQGRLLLPALRELYRWGAAQLALKTHQGTAITALRDSAPPSGGGTQ